MNEPVKHSSSNDINDNRVDSNDTLLQSMKDAIGKLNELLDKKSIITQAVEADVSNQNDASNETSALTSITEETTLASTTEEIVNTARKVVDLAAQQEAAYKRLTNAAETANTHLNQIYDQGHCQAKHWFKLGIIAASIGFLIILIGAVIAMFSTNISSGILTSLAATIPGAVAALFFQQAKEANKRLDEFYNRLIEIEGINRAIEITFTADDEIQDRYKGLIIYKLLGLQTKGQEVPILDLVMKNREIRNTAIFEKSIKQSI